jgi:hypothetical protein
MMAHSSCLFQTSRGILIDRVHRSTSLHTSGQRRTDAGEWVFYRQCEIFPLAAKSSSELQMAAHGCAGRLDGSSLARFDEELS